MDKQRPFPSPTLVERPASYLGVVDGDLCELGWSIAVRFGKDDGGVVCGIRGEMMKMNEAQGGG